MDVEEALDFARSTRQSVLVTLRANGRPQLSNVWHHVGADGRIRISVTTDRAKYTNLRREGWAALHVTRGDFDAYAVIDAEVELSPIAASPDDATVEELVAHYRRIVGEHEDWDGFRRAQVEQQRVVVRLTPTSAYGMLP
ncbi:MAG: PPOX class F420-dependent enzyme [Acidimicrobiia bacterium]